MHQSNNHMLNSVNKEKKGTNMQAVKQDQKSQLNPKKSKRDTDDKEPRKRRRVSRLTDRERSLCERYRTKSLLALAVDERTTTGEVERWLEEIWSKHKTRREMDVLYHRLAEHERRMETLLASNKDVISICANVIANFGGACYQLPGAPISGAYRETAFT